MSKGSCADCGDNLQSNWLCPECRQKPENVDWVIPSSCEVPLYSPSVADENPRLADVTGKGSYWVEAEIIELARTKCMKVVRIKGTIIRGGDRHIKAYAYTLEQVAKMTKHSLKTVRRILKKNNIGRRK